MGTIENNKELFEFICNHNSYVDPSSTLEGGFFTTQENAKKFLRINGQFSNVINHTTFDRIDISGIKNVAFFYCRATLVGVKDPKTFHFPGVDGPFPECFLDSRGISLEYNSLTGEEGLKIRSGAHTLGYFFPERNVLFATDWTHSDRGITLGIKVLDLILNKSGEHSLCFLSQKAKSLFFLSEETYLSLPVFPTETQSYKRAGFFPAFIRTCPKNPRHGILESKIVSNSKELKTSIDTLKAQMELLNETEGEIIIQPFVEASSNFVWSEGMFVIAPDHDGVTAGKTPKITLSVKAPWFYKGALRELALEEAEMEGVISSSNLLIKEQTPYFTQVRKAEGHFSSGLKPKRKGVYEGFCSELTKATNLLIVRGLDGLLELEESRIKDTVCLHVQGNLLSHASAWCRQNKTPYIVLEKEEDIDSFKGKWIYEVEKGWILCQKSKPKSMKKRKVKRSEKFEDSFFKGIDDSLVADLNKLSSKGWFTYLPFQHYASQKTINPEVSYLAGFFVGVLCRSVEAISVGEFRHSKVRSSSRNNELYEFLFLREDPVFKSEYYETHRDLIYRDVFSCWTCSSPLLEEIKKQFEVLIWDQAYGGKKWGKIIEFAILIRSLIETKKIKRIISETNKALNSIHNSGWAFDKIISKKYLEIVYVYSSCEGSARDFLLLMENNLSLLQGNFEKVTLQVKGEIYEEDKSKSDGLQEEGGDDSTSNSFYKPLRL